MIFSNDASDNMLGWHSIRFALTGAVVSIIIPFEETSEDTCPITSRALTSPRTIPPGF